MTIVTKTTEPMTRRRFLKLTAATGAVIALGGAVYVSTKDTSGLTLQNAINELDKLATQSMSSTVDWDPAQIFNHCAQSVEYSMTGYTEHKSALFKSTVGVLAFSIFSGKGTMNHGLSEPIPGAPLLPAQQDLQQALARLKQSLLDFDRFDGEYAPHFAYGKLTKQQYTAAHVMHINNHMQQIKIG
ncbi:MAG: DUF1569 domain-containing protein [Psychrosphaera sp.]|nr:DUF1569 domain-containing protein [Psychrosphaera sp.]